MSEDAADPEHFIRESSPDDVDELVSFLDAFFQLRQLLPRTREELLALSAQGFVVVAPDGRIVGFAAVEVYSKKMAELQCLAVDASTRGLGLGRELVVRCVDRARELGVRELMAITSSEALFLDCGFHYSLPGQKRALFVQTSDPHGDS